MNDKSQPRGGRILIVEDDMMLALLLEDQLADLGYETVKAARVSKGVSLADLGYETIKAARVSSGVALAAKAQLAAAILDVNVAGEASYPVAWALRERRIPFIFATGYGAGGLAAEFRDGPTLNKPYSYDELRRVLARALNSGPSGEPPAD